MQIGRATPARARTRPHAHPHDRCRLTNTTDFSEILPSKILHGLSLWGPPYFEWLHGVTPKT